MKIELLYGKYYLASRKNNIHMTAKLNSLFGKSLLLSALIALSTNITSCDKKTNADDAKKFVATWKGKSTCTGVVNGADELTLSAGSDGVTATMPITAGMGTCLVERKLTGTANEDILTFAQQTVSDGCGKTYQVSGFASIIGDSISLTIHAEGDSTGICNFRGKKS